jgi:hypothetical protein
VRDLVSILRGNEIELDAKVAFLNQKRLMRPSQGKGWERPDDPSSGQSL